MADAQRVNVYLPVTLRAAVKAAFPGEAFSQVVQRGIMRLLADLPPAQQRRILRELASELGEQLGLESATEPRRSAAA